VSGEAKPDCPNCGRPIGYEYTDVEQGKCQLWRWFNSCSGNLDRVPQRTLSDCFGMSRRIRELSAKLAETEASRRAAQSSLGRHHTAASVQKVEEESKQDMFPDGARIEVV